MLVWIDLNVYTPTHIDKYSRAYSIPEHKIELIAKKKSKLFINYIL